jgi:integrase
LSLWNRSLQPGDGWHTFATLLKAKGEDVKTVQELLRHATSAVTTNVYAEGVTELKRKAPHRIVRMVTGVKSGEEEEIR